MDYDYTYRLLYKYTWIDSPVGSLFASDEENSDNDENANFMPLNFNPYPIRLLGK